MARKMDAIELVAGLGVLSLGLVVTTFVVENLRERAAIDALVPPAAAAFRAFREALAAAGIKLKIGQTVRTGAQQQTAVDTGHSSTSHSWHLLRRALDVYPYDPVTGLPDMDGKNLELFRTMHRVAKGFGFEGLAFNPDGSRRYLINKQGKKYWDGGHLQFPQGMTYAAALAADRKAGYYA